MREVVLHVYDVTNSESEKTNNVILQINKIFKDGIGLGGIFHGAVQVYGEDEWSFGLCEEGTGVFSCPAKKNPMYTYRESVVLGETECSILNVNRILRNLSREWPGSSYDLLSKNCNHFCNEFCEMLGVPKPPGWVNNFANVGGSAVEVAENTAMRLQQARTGIASASKTAYQYLLGVTSNVRSEEAPRLQTSWFKNLITTGDKPSSSSSGIQDEDESEQLQQKQEDDGREMHRHNSSSHDNS